MPRLREILDSVLTQRNLSYGQMRLLLIDTDSPPESMLDEDDIQTALEQISKDLNYLTILTDRSAYFHDYVETMYEETGLLVQLEDKTSIRKYEVNTVLDFEQKGSFWKVDLCEPSLYIPVYKKSWESTDNLDISVPIGYNTVIVKGIQITV